MCGNHHHGTGTIAADGGDGCIVTQDSSCVISEVSVPSTQLESLFETLSSQRRRIILYHLISSDEEVVEREELAEVIAEREPDSNQSSKDEIVGDLHHKTLPRLLQDGFIDYDPRQGTVRNESPDELTRCLSIVHQLEDTEVQFT